MLLRSLFFASFMLISMMGYAQQEKHDTSIAISQTHLPQPTRPRKPEHIVIECFYDALSESIHFHFLEDLGGAIIEVTNTATGEMFYGMCPSAPGACNVAISGEQGMYTIQIEDGYNHYYTGSFALD